MKSMTTSPDHAVRLKKKISPPDEEIQYPKMVQGGQREGYVYLIRLEVKRAFKIGRSLNPTNRLRDFVIDMPLDLILLYAFPADDYHDAESELQMICKENG